MKSNHELLEVFSQSKVPLSKQLALVAKLSVPAILAQITSVAMQYIDAAMVGSLGANASASIGLVTTSMWFVYGVSFSLGTGFSVQVAQAFGANDMEKARKITKQSVGFVSFISIIIASFTIVMSFYLPGLLGASKDIWRDASSYFMVFGFSQPFVMLGSLGVGILQSTGNMKLPSFLSAFTCVLDVLFNALFIFPARQITLAGFLLTVPGFGLGVTGAALGTAVSELVICVVGFIFVFLRSNELKFCKEDKWIPEKSVLRKAMKIGVPMAFERVAVNGAQVFSTKIVAPLGTVAIAANSFSITAEALCYMPCYGVSRAATTLTGQSIGAKREDLAKKFAWLSVISGMCVMTFTAAVMYFAAPSVFSFLTPVADVQNLGVSVLRIQLLVEPLFAASIVVTGALRGVGDTLVPGIMNLASMWGVRLPIAYFLSMTMGLRGVWIAMSLELVVRGILFLARLYFKKFVTL